MKHLLPTLVVALAAASQLGSTDCGQVLRDSGFDLWCGDHMCAWNVERGRVQRVPTWNEGDPGVELVGDDVAISQLSPVASTDGHCLEFDLIANLDLDAHVVLNVDVFGDGSVEDSEPLPTARWQKLRYQLPIAGAYAGVRFELAKTGRGHAVLAQIGAHIAEDCGDVAAIQPDPAPLGAPCTSDDACASGRCGSAPGHYEVECVACASGTCDAGEVCGLGAPTSPVLDLPVRCVPAAARALGEQCATDAECASGICTYGANYATGLYPGAEYGVCSTCRPNASGGTSLGCAAGEACGPAWPAGPDNLHGIGPYLCSPNAHAHAAGEPCASDADCASGTCAGTPRMQCDDGRACTTAADCPFGTPDTENGLQNGPCDTVGVQGGSCQ